MLPILEMGRVFVANEENELFLIKNMKETKFTNLQKIPRAIRAGETVMVKN